MFTVIEVKVIRVGRRVHASEAPTIKKAHGKNETPGFGAFGAASKRRRICIAEIS